MAAMVDILDILVVISVVMVAISVMVIIIMAMVTAIGVAAFGVQALLDTDTDTDMVPAMELVSHGATVQQYVALIQVHIVSKNQAGACFLKKKIRLQPYSSLLYRNPQ